MARSDIGRLNFGPIPTTTIQWDQPHEGNLFTHLYQQRAFQRTKPSSRHTELVRSCACEYGYGTEPSPWTSI